MSAVIPFVFLVVLGLAQRREGQLAGADAGTSGGFADTSSLDVLADITDARMIPRAGEIRLPIGQPRYWLAGSGLGSCRNRRHRRQRESHHQGKDNPL